MRINIYFRKLVTLFLISGFILIFSCNRTEKKAVPGSAGIIDLPQIRDKGKMIVVTDFSSINYFIYKGKPMGFQYELLQELADYLNIELEVRVNNDLRENLESLIRGEADLLASCLDISGESEALITFTEPHSQSAQVLVQRIDTSKLQEKFIRNPMHLAGKKIHVMKNSSYSYRLHKLSEEIDKKIHVYETPLETEQIIRKVAQKEIDYTVAYENIARVYTQYYPGLDISTTISFPQDQSWAVRKDAVILRSEINRWLVEFKRTRLYAILKNKYFDNPQSVKIVNSEYYYPHTGRISKYDSFLKYESMKIDWDWRLLASMVYQESRFNHDVTSWAGAFGIMQLMPVTARRFGVSRKSSPEENIRAGVNLILWLENRFTDRVPDKEERIKFILASYNIGYGHIDDAMRLAEKYGKNPSLWKNNVEYFLLKKSNPEFYKDPVVKHGYARAIQTCKYVDEILDRYQHYRNLEIIASN